MIAPYHPSPLDSHITRAITGDRGAPLAIVTGASSGVGEALAARLGDRGYRRVLIARRRRPLMRLAASGRMGPATIPEIMDLGRVDEIAPTLTRIIDAYGAPDVLINNAATGVYRAFLEHDANDFERMMRVNYLAAVEMTRSVLPSMLRRRRGTVINIASMAAKVGPWGHSAYAATKAAMVSLTQTLAAEYEGSGVNFCYVSLGIVRTDYFNHPQTRDLWPLVEKRAMEPGPVADKILTLLDRPRLELAIPRHYRLLDWVRAVNPWWAVKLVRTGSRPRAVPARPAADPCPASR